MVRAAGFEPAATGSQSRSATAAPRPELKTLPCIGLHCLAIPLRATLCRALPRLSLHGKDLLLKAFPLPLPPLSGGGVKSEIILILVSRAASQPPSVSAPAWGDGWGATLPRRLRPSSRLFSKSRGSRWASPLSLKTVSLILSVKSRVIETFFKIFIPTKKGRRKPPL